MVIKLVMFGASGGTGRCVVEQALASGHDVTAVVRDPARLPDQNVAGGNSISRADLADALLDSLADPAAIRATFGIGY